MSPPLLKRMQEAVARARARRADEPVRREPSARHAWRRFRRATDRYRLLTDVLGGILIVAIVVGGLAAATGGVWPPVVVVESGSMMHAIQETPYGRFGTIDVGDLVFLRAVDSRDDVRTWAEGGELRYGRPGDVIAFWPNGDRNATPIIHRAIAYIEVESDPVNVGQRTYRLHWIDGTVRVWDSRGIYFPPLGFDETSPFIFTPTQGYTPPYSGFITKGDNWFSNPATDQAMGISYIVDVAWVEAKVYGEVPWVGLTKLALQSGQTNPEVPGWTRIGNAFAPLELWMMLFVTLAVVILVPLSIDTYRAWRKLKLEQEAARRIEEENARVAAARRAAERQEAQKRTVSFAEVVSPRPLKPRPPGR
ncbi:MAG TPA: S26 family signal peptidase [Candidatus Thermoplasmatota archaeon]|nr:S26 family signal peptidase [Candidatus Thermoplasmatota archaeon]